MIDTRRIINNSNINNQLSEIDRNTLRELLINDKFKWEAQWPKSPIYDKDLINDQLNILGDNFVYERNIRYPTIEKSYESMFEFSQKWQSKVLLYDSGMSSIIGVIQSYLEGYSDKDVSVITTDGYFESAYYLKTLKNCEIDVLSETEDITKEYDILYIEPVTYSVNMRVVDIYKAVLNFTKVVKTNYIKLIIIDSTLVTNFKIDINKIREILPNNGQIMLIIVESLLKLHQLGLEVSNGGMSYITFLNGTNYSSYFEEYIKQAEKNRELYSMNLSLADVRGLSNDFMTNKSLIIEYTDKIYLNNGLFALSVKNKKFEILHPSNNNIDFTWAVSPFIIIILKQDHQSDYRRLLVEIQDKVNKLNFKLNYGSSFGFFESRIELINYDIILEKWFIKLSIGYDDGNLQKLIKIFNEL